MVYANAYCRWREWDANIRGRFRSANKSGDLTVLDNPKFHPLPLRLSSPPSLSLWEFLGEQVYSNDLLPFLDPFPLSREFIWKYRKQRQRGSVANVGHFFSSHFLITSFLFLLVPLPGILFSEYSLPIFPNIVFSRYDACNLPGWAARVLNENRAYLWFEEFIRRKV